MFRKGFPLLLLFLGMAAGRADAQAFPRPGNGTGQTKAEWPRAVEDDRRELAYAQKRSNRERAVRVYVEVATSQDAALRTEAEALLAEIPSAERAPQYVKLLEHPYHIVRTYTASHIAELKDKKSVAPLYKMALGDVYAPAREASVHALADMLGPNETVRGLGEAVFSEQALARMRAIEGIGKLGFVGGVEVIIRRIKLVGGGGPRSYFYHAEETAYIRDYDVEIATAAAAYDPIIGTVVDGVVLDIKVLRVEEEMTIIERRVVNGALEGLTGMANKKGNMDGWLAWWEANQDDPKWHLAAK